MIRELAAVLLLAASLEAQVCRLSVAGLNRNRRVIGDVNAECPNQPLHSAPFGNWGVTSNFGPKVNGRQFEGWCQNQRICDNNGFCRTACGDRWFEWNSCTDHPLFRAPNCTLYNDKDCTEQVTTRGENVLGTQTVEVRVSCPLDLNGDGVADAGGCRDVPSYEHGQNFMSLYELDPLTGDELVQTLYFPATPVPLSCSAVSCPAAGSNWVPPFGYDSPASPARVFAEMATVVNFGEFVDSALVCRTATGSLRSASSASFRGPEAAAGSIVSAFGADLSSATEAAGAMPLPATLAGGSVRIQDSAGAAHTASLLLVSPGQVNFIVPANAALGQATVSLLREGQVRATGILRIVRVSPGIFAANATGQGVAAATAVLGAGGGQTFPPVFACGTAPLSCFAVPLDLGGPADQLYLVLYGTGWARHSGSVRATIGGAAAEAPYAGAQPSFPGLDQINLLAPRALAGRGEVEVRVTVDGKDANPVTVRIR